MKGVKKYKLQLIKEISPREVMYNMVTIINNTMLYI